ncbi:MAG: adenylosuccinate lyase, partial [Armatimonadetes bacterium]|nr:adenylosuccinate lyase [Armatimonadota bacterium]
MSLRSISPLDGRYEAAVAPLSEYFSEYALIRYRVIVELHWLLEMSERPEIGGVRAFTEAERAFVTGWMAELDEAAAQRVKEIESTTRHDVKAVEYYIRERLRETSLADVEGFIHFCCTSEDINNLAYGMMLKEAVEQQWLPRARQLVDQVAALAETNRSVPLLSRTHGQTASPSTLGKELAVFVARWERQLRHVAASEYLGKFNGAVGCYNTHVLAYPEAPWLEISQSLVARLGLTWNP